MTLLWLTRPRVGLVTSFIIFFQIAFQELFGRNFNTQIRIITFRSSLEANQSPRATHLLHSIPTNTNERTCSSEYSSRLLTLGSPSLCSQSVPVFLFHWVHVLPESFGRSCRRSCLWARKKPRSIHIIITFDKLNHFFSNPMACPTIFSVAI